MFFMLFLQWRLVERSLLSHFSIGRPVKISFISMRFKFLASSIQVEFKHMGQSANGLADFLAKQGVDRLLLCFYSLCNLFLL